MASRRPPAAEPRQSVLFSGHLIDAPSRRKPRFPADKEPIAAAAIAGALGKIDARSADTAFCQAAAGGDLLFLEACQRRGLRCEIMLPFPEPEFIDRSVRPVVGGAMWEKRYHAVRAAPNTVVRIMSAQGSRAYQGSKAYEQCNLWMLEAALAAGPERLRFICLWNGEEGDGPGGTRHMVESVKTHSGQVLVLDTNLLWQL